MTASRPHVGVSACLFGERVRYDGRDKHAPDLIAALSTACELIPVCPEVETGMGVPREAVRLVGQPEAPRMLSCASLQDWTDATNAWARGRIRALVADGLDGFVLKSRSPSCGVRSIPVAQDDGTELQGRGLFADTLLGACPDLPVVEEAELADAAAIDRFLAAVRRRRESRGTHSV